MMEVWEGVRVVIPTPQASRVCKKLERPPRQLLGRELRALVPGSLPTCTPSLASPAAGTSRWPSSLTPFQRFTGTCRSIDPENQNEGVCGKFSPIWLACIHTPWNKMRDIPCRGLRSALFASTQAECAIHLSRMPQRAILACLYCL